MLKIAKIHIDYMLHPMGIVEYPQIGWTIESDRINCVQQAYRLQIGKDDSFETIVYDSQWILDGESVYHRPMTYPLESATLYYVRVRVRDDQNEESFWGMPTFFCTGLIESEWTGRFITAETNEDAANSKGTYLRRDFTISKPIQKAILFSTALGLYHSYLNGQKASDDEMAPGWSTYKKRLLYQTNDVTDFLVEGKNTLGAHVGAGWYKGLIGLTKKRNLYGNRTGFLAEIHIRYKDGTQEIISTDTEWTASDSPVLFSEIYDGEIYDATKEQPCWSTPDFRAITERTWRKVNVIDYPLNQLFSQPGSRVKSIETRPVKDMFRTPQGDLVLDFGQNMAGWIEFKVKGNIGDKVQLHCFEVLDADGNVYVDNLRDAKQTIIYTCGNGKTADSKGFEHYRPYFTYQGFRYAKICAYPGEPEASYFIAHTVHSEMERTGYFECSNPDLNQLQHNIMWGLKSNFLDVPTDCPQRDERLGWTGDAQIFCRTATYIMNTHQFFSKWLRDLAADQTEEGGVTHVVPDIITGISDDNWLLKQGTHSAAAWADAAVINPWTLYLTFGDLGVVNEQYASMKAWIDFMSRHSVDGIWNYKLQFGDWVALDAEEGSYFGATPNDLTCTAYYAYSTSLFSKMAQACGKLDDYANYTKLYDSIVDKFRTTFFDQEGNLTAQTQTAHVIALYFKLTPEKWVEKTVQRLVELIEAENGHLVTGFVGTPYICHALSQNGKVKEAYDLLLKDDLPSWLYQVKMGATTIWEHWDGLKPDGTMWSPDMNSFNHYAYGAIGEWLYRVVVGLEVDERKPGYKHSIIRPLIGGNLDFVKGRYESVYGPIQVEWKRETAMTYTLSVEIPVNTTSTIYLEQASSVVSTNGLDVIKEDKGYALNAGSGRYKIQFTIE